MDFSQFKLSNIRRGPLSTTIGLLIGAIAIAGVFLTQKVSWEGAMAVIMFITIPLALSDDTPPRPPAMLILVIGVCLLLLSCGRPPQRHTETTDSTWVLEKLRPVSVKIPSSKADLKLRLQLKTATRPGEKPRIESVSQLATNQRATVAVSVAEDGTLTATAVCDSLEVVLQAKDREINRMRSEKTKEMIPVRYTAWYDIACRWLALAFLLVASFYALKIYHHAKLH